MPIAKISLLLKNPHSQKSNRVFKQVQYISLMRQKFSQKWPTLFFAQERNKVSYDSYLRSDSFQVTTLLQSLLKFSTFVLCKCAKLFKKLVRIILLIIILLTITNYLSQMLKHEELYKNFNHQQISSHLQQHNKKTKMTFYEFKQKYNKKYPTLDEELFRSIVFYRNLNKINTHNQLKTKTYTMGVNQFADLTVRQFASIYTSLYKSDGRIKAMAQQIISKGNESYMKDQIIPVLTNNSINSYYPTTQAAKQSIIRHQQLSISNPQFTTLDELLFEHKKHSLLYRYSHIHPLQQSLTITPSSNPTQTTTTSSQIDGNFTTDVVIDWTVYSGKIRYQGVCGACYTFATSDTVAALYSIYKFGFFIPLSTQQVVDCSSNGLTYGCSGGFLQGSYAYMQINGIQPDHTYPYTSSVDGIDKTCSVTGGPFKVLSFRNIDEGDCKGLVSELKYGPVSIGIAGYRLQFYENGIFNDCNDYVDHAVVLVAYQAGIGWKIKNSWGPQWGINGFAWIQDGNNCGICDMAVSAKIPV